MSEVFADPVFNWAIGSMYVFGIVVWVWAESVSVRPGKRSKR